MYKKVLITTAIDYANDVIHIGHAYQKILADCVARYYRQKLGEENVFYVTGTDLFGQKNEKAAKAAGVSPAEHVAKISDLDEEQLKALGIGYNRFIRTTDADHMKNAQEFYLKSFEAGDIYKAKYQGLYCDGCESYKTLTELTEDGKCPFHPKMEVQKIEEDNYFFKWSGYQEFLTELLLKPEFVVPEGKKKEMQALVEQGLKDLPVSRPKYKVGWGIDVPNDSEQVIYVWFDALINYHTAAKETGFWNEDTKIIHFLGKDNAKWHALLWPAMLESAGLKSPDTIYVHGFINLDGQKISKSLGNIIRPTDLVAQFGTDAVRYYFLKHGPVVEDSNFTLDHIKEVYNADLANGLGNTVARIAKLAQNSGLEFDDKNDYEFLWDQDWAKPFEDYRTDVVLQNIWKRLSEIDKHINENKPWEIKDLDKLQKVLEWEVSELRYVCNMIEPFMPETAKKIQEIVGSKKISAAQVLFPRLPDVSKDK